MLVPNLPRFHLTTVHREPADLRTANMAAGKKLENNVAEVSARNPRREQNSKAPSQLYCKNYSPQAQ